MATNGTTDTQIISGINGSGTYLPLSFYTNNTLGAQLDTSGNLAVTGRLSFSALSAAANIDGIFLQSGVGTTVNTATGNNLTFNVGTTERMRIASNGNVGVNGTPATTGDTAQKFQAIGTGIYVESYTYTGGRSQFWTAGAEGTGANSYHVFSASNTGVYIAYGATSWTGFSDTRLKNITGTYTNALDGLMQLEPIKFTWKSDDTNKPCVGVSAQSVENVVPEAVDKNKIAGSNDDTEYLAIRYTELIPIMIASIQEQQAIINELKTRIEALESK
jgi:hypothetical protein